MSEFPRYDRYPADILADTQHLTLAEYGAYNRLLDTMWLQGARLPNDPKMLCRIVHAANMHWPIIWPRLQEFFIVSEDGKWITQKRMSEEYEKARERSELQKAKVDKRWKKSAVTASNPSAMTASNPSAMDARNPLENNKQGHTGVYAPARATPAANNQHKDKNEALSKGASSYPVASDVPSGASSARDPNAPADPNCPMLVQAEAEMIEQYRRAKHIREKLKAAGFKGLRIIPP